MTNYEGLSGDLGVSAVTIKNWCSILEASFISHFLDPDTNNLGRTVVKTPKLYLGRFWVNVLFAEACV